MSILRKKDEIVPDTVLQRKNDLLFNEIDGEVVMLSIENGEYYGINKVGSRIWKLLEKPMLYKEILNIIIKEYNVTKEQCDSDLKRFIQILEEKKLLYH